jgi:coenzyme F420 biosynthesis associated uncharacterized protein
VSRTSFPRVGGRNGNLPVDRRLIAVGLLAGAAVGAWASGRLRAATPSDGQRGLIDWEQARGIAVNMNRGATLTSVERSRLDDYYRDLVRRCVPIVSAYTQTDLPDTIERTFAFDRVDWINANLDSFKIMLAPIEALNPDTGGSRTVIAAMWGGLNRTVVSAELGLLLGYLARRVLGQYDLALLGREPVSAGKLYYVEPNIRMVEKTLGLPRDEFRMWLALHETTHAFEFEAHPWVRLYFNDLLESYFEFLRQDAEHLKQGFRGLKVFIDRARSGERTESWIEAVMTPEQRELFSKMQRLARVSSRATTASPANSSSASASGRSRNNSSRVSPVSTSNSNNTGSVSASSTRSPSSAGMMWPAVSGTAPSRCRHSKR